MLWRMAFGLDMWSELALDIVVIVLVFVAAALAIYNRRLLGVWKDVVGYKHLAVVIGRDRMARLCPVSTQDGQLFTIEGLDRPQVLIEPEASYFVKNSPYPMHISFVYLPSGVAIDAEKGAAISQFSRQGKELLDYGEYEKDEDGRVTGFRQDRDEEVVLDKPVSIRVQDIVKWLINDYNPKALREIWSSAQVSGMGIIQTLVKQFNKYMIYYLILGGILILIAAFM